MATKAKWTNRQRLNRKLKALPTVLKKRIGEAMAKGADETNDVQFHLCPVDSSFEPRHRPGALRGTISWAWGDVPRPLASPVPNNPPGPADDVIRLTIYAGSVEAFWGWYVEHGTSDTPAQPFFFAGWHVTRKRVVARIITARNKALKEVAAMGGSSQ